MYKKYIIIDISMSKIQGPGSDYTIEVKFDRSNATYKP